MSFLSIEQINNIGFKSVGNDVFISDKANFYGASNISIGNNVRIDDFCIISANDNGIEIGNFVHVAVYCSLIGSERITLSDFSGLSSRVSVYSSSDDYSGSYLTNPTVSSEFTNVTSKPVFLGKHVIVGAGSVILPGVTIEEGCAVGALSLVTKSMDSYKIVAGNPAKVVKKRKTNLVELEQLFLDKISGNQ